jgi:hypothetical protein
VIASAVAKLWIGIGIGIGAGFVLTAISFLIRILKSDSLRQRIYLIYFLLIALAVPIVSDILKCPDAKFVAIITSGYLINLLNERDIHERR